MNTKEGVIPVEVKSGINTKAKSLGIYKNRYSPQKNILLSAKEFIGQNRGTTYIPIYCVSVILKN